jgi:hypothetical protein
MPEEKRAITGRLIRRDEDDRSFDRAFWQRQGSEAIFAAMWEMVQEVRLFRGQDANESRLDRSVQRIVRREI